MGSFEYGFVAIQHSLRDQRAMPRLFGRLRVAFEAVICLCLCHENGWEIGDFWADLLRWSLLA